MRSHTHLLWAHAMPTPPVQGTRQRPPGHALREYTASHRCSHCTSSYLSTKPHPQSLVPLGSGSRGLSRWREATVPTTGARSSARAFPRIPECVPESQDASPHVAPKQQRDQPERPLSTQLPSSPFTCMLEVPLPCPRHVGLKCDHEQNASSTIPSI